MFETPLRSLMSFISITLVVFVGGLLFSANNQVSYNWQPMTGDYSASELNALLNPVTESVPQVESAMEKPALTSNVEDPMNYVFWLNVSGFRTDYVENANTPFFDRATRRGYFSKRLNPTFPTLSWPSLVSQITGTTPDAHGIVSDVMRAPASGEMVRNPVDLSFLKAEPVWTTAKRQGIRTLVHDWPFSQQQPEGNSADVFLPEFDPAAKDDARLKTLLEAWKANAGSEKDRLRLIMASLGDLDEAARAFGCRADQTYSAVAELDGRLASFFGEIESSWSEFGRNGDRLYIVITTDHGMIDVTKLVNLKQLIADDMRPYAQIAISDTVGHVWVQNLPESVPMDTALTKIEEAMGDRIYWDIYRRDSLPEDWSLGSGDHIGDLVIQLKSGYAFTDETGSEAVFSPTEVNGQVAASGLTVRSSSRMRGPTWIFEGMASGEPVAGGEIDATQLHATVCKILGIEPSPDANPSAIDYAPVTK